MRRAAVSIPANIAEGQGRSTDGEFLNQLSVAHGSVRELETHALIAGRLNLLEPQAVSTILDVRARSGASSMGFPTSYADATQAVSDGPWDRAVRDSSI